MNDNPAFIYELGDALLKLRDVIENKNMGLISIELSSWEDGNNFISLLDKEHMLYVAQGIDQRTGEMVNQCEVAGVLVRWPTMRKALRSGGFKFI